jgi:stromal membrane-associated protein
MADPQKILKKKLKTLMSLVENQTCSDCPEKKPTWASIVVPPPDAPQGTEKLGAFVCLECSGSHRRLGVHIAFVRSVNLDSCKCRFSYQPWWVMVVVILFYLRL